MARSPRLAMPWEVYTATVPRSFPKGICDYLLRRQQRRGRSGILGSVGHRIRVDIDACRPRASSSPRAPTPRWRGACAAGGVRVRLQWIRAVWSEAAWLFGRPADHPFGPLHRRHREDVRHRPDQHEQPAYAKPWQDACAPECGRKSLQRFADPPRPWRW